MTATINEKIASVRQPAVIAGEMTESSSNDTLSLTRTNTLTVNSSRSSRTFSSSSLAARTYTSLGSLSYAEPRTFTWPNSRSTSVMMNLSAPALMEGKYLTVSMMMTTI